MIYIAPLALALMSAHFSKSPAQSSPTRIVLPVATQDDGFKPQGGLIPITLEVEKAVPNSALAIGTNLYPRNLGGTDPILSIPLFANDDLATALGFTNPALFNTPILNANPSPQLFDWVKDTIVNNDPPTLQNSVATGIQLGLTGTYFEGQPRGHWYGLRFVDGIGNLDRDVFVKGGKEDSPSQWIIGPGSVGSAKYDITQAYLADTAIATTDTVDFPTGIEHILYFDMERRGNDGTTAFDFEFNQQPPTGPYIPNRTEGDVLFTFEVNGSSTSGTATPHIYLYHNGNYLSNEFLVSQLPPALQPIMGLNEVNTPSEPWGFVNAKGAWTIGQIPRFCVAESAVPFDVSTGLGPCLGHKAFMQIRTRSSASQTSDLKDMTQFLVVSFDAPPHAQLEVQANCDASFTYSGAGSRDGQGGTNLEYDWTIRPPAGIALVSSDPGLTLAGDGTYRGTFTSDALRSISALLPDGVDFADVQISLKVQSPPASCADETVFSTVRVWRTLAVGASLSNSSGNDIDFSSTVTGGKAPYLYHWTFLRQGSPDVQVGSSTAASGSFTAPTPGTYYGVLMVNDTADASADFRVIGKPSCQILRTTNVVTIAGQANSFLSRLRTYQISSSAVFLPKCP